MVLGKVRLDMDDEEKAIWAISRNEEGIQKRVVEVTNLLS